MPSVYDISTPLVAPRSDGVVYSNNVLMPAAEGELGDWATRKPYDQQPVPVAFNQAAIAIVKFTSSGGAGTGYVVLQTDLNNDGVWVDLAWCSFSGTTATFLLCAGAFVGNSVQQTRTSATPPVGNGSIQCPLGGRLKFVGKGSLSGSSSSSLSSGQVNTSGVRVTITLKMVGLR